MKTVEISIVIPVYNSEKCLDALNQEIMAELDGTNYELILVNDKSPDNSWQQIVIHDHYILPNRMAKPCHNRIVLTRILFQANALYTRILFSEF